MKTIGLIGGMSWESTVSYYKIINEKIKQELGGLHSAKIILYSVDFAEVEKCQATDRWDLATEILANAAKKLELAGADFILICTNTMHKIFAEVQAHVKVPLIHIADATMEALQNRKISKVLLLGTKYTMLEDFYKGRLEQSEMEVFVPNLEEVELINKIIFEELCLGIIKEKSREYLKKIIEHYTNLGVTGVILGCTELGLIVHQEDLSIPAFDTALIHAEKAAALCMVESLYVLSK